MNRFLAVALLSASVLALHSALARERTNFETPKEALQELNDFIGGWKGNGTSAKSSTAIWKETVKWGWRFKGKDVCLTLGFENGKFLKGGQLRYLMDRKVYQLTALDKDGKKQVYDGTLKKGRLILERKDPETKETQQIKMNLAGGGIRFIYTVSHKPANRTLFTDDFQVACTKIGESFGAKAKKIECVVSGGLGTIPVTYKGVTYYVCCSGCRDAFHEEPEKYIKEYEAKKKGK